MTIPERVDRRKPDLMPVEPWEGKVEELLARCQAFTEAAVAGKWPPRRSLRQLNILVPQIQLIAQQYLDALRPLVRPDGDSWANRKCESEWRCYYDDGKDQYRSTPDICDRFEGARRADERLRTDTPMEQLVDFVFVDVFCAFEYGAVWERLKDQFGENNPFLPLIALYGLGATSIDFYLVNGEEKLVIDFPLKGKRDGLVACWVEGDKRVYYGHELNKRCDEARPISIPGRRIEIDYGEEI